MTPRSRLRVPFVAALALLACAPLARAETPALPDADAHETAWSRYIAELWGGETEHVLADGSRVDVLTARTAWEVEWATGGRHWEAIGQALYYAIWTNREPGIVLLLKDPADMRFVYRTQIVCAKYGIRLKVCDVKSGDLSVRLYTVDRHGTLRKVGTQ